MASTATAREEEEEEAMTRSRSKKVEREGRMLLRTRTTEIDDLHATIANNDHNHDDNSTDADPVSSIIPIPASALAKGGSKSLAGISLRAFSLGVLFGVAGLATIQLACLSYININININMTSKNNNDHDTNYHHRALSLSTIAPSFWRATCFTTVLSLFHFLEFHSTARYNPIKTQVSSFLLSTNGSAYNVAHVSALLEFSARQLFLATEWGRGWQDAATSSWWSGLATNSLKSGMLSRSPVMLLVDLSPNLPLILGFILIIFGQAVRTAAMAEAGTSFNHIVQSHKRQDHNLIETGVYRIFRHPSYFGFFWWGLGTQLFLGNTICLVAYAVVLWKFFANRIVKEEKFLVRFFGKDYESYRARTAVWIPFMG